jgi:hypothetical protein
MGTDINDSKLVDGKKKNGHKSNCSCHICENMKNKAKRGGYVEEIEKEKENMMGGSKKKNGHRKACKCPICKNMKNSKKRGGAKYKRTKKRRGGDNEEDSEDKELDEELDDETENDTDSSDEEEEGEEEEQNEEEDNMGGRRKKRSNGHKPNCKNMRKKKGGYPNDEQPDEENQIGDIEEAGVKATSGSYLQSFSTPSGSESVASSSDYDALDNAEKGQAGENIIGGTRKRLKGGKKWGGKTRKARRYRRRR